MLQQVISFVLPIQLPSLGGSKGKTLSFFSLSLFFLFFFGMNNVIVVESYLCRHIFVPYYMIISTKYSELRFIKKKKYSELRID